MRQMDANRKGYNKNSFQYEIASEDKTLHS